MESGKLVFAVGALICAGGSIAAAGAASPGTHLNTPPADQVADEPTERTANRVRLRDDGEDRLTIPVRIDGSGPFEFLIDTGAEGTILSDRLVTRLGIEPSGKVNIVSMADRARVDTVDVGSVAFAGRDIGGLAAPVLQYDHMGVDGILGLDALQNLRVLIDFRKGTMDVEDAYQKPTGGPYEIVVRARRLRGQMVITDATVDGVDAAIIIDTGAQFSIGNYELLRQLRAKEREAVQGTDVLGTNYEGRIGYLREIRIDRLRVSEMPIAFFDSPAFTQMGYGKKPALLLGISNLRQLDRVAIDFHNRKVLFDVPRQMWENPGMRF